MNSQEELLSFLDLLDLDEEVIDNRLKSIMGRSNYTNQHLRNALQLLKYKQLINIQENTECSNEDEFDFVAKLIKAISADTVESVCRITNTVLQLNTDKLVSYSEHLLLQILDNIDLSVGSPKNSELENPSPLLYLKVCDSVLDAATKQGQKLSMVFLDTSLEEILSSGDEQLKIHFITNSVPKLVEGIDGYDILSRIWIYLEKFRKDCKSTTLKIISSLSDFYLPIARNAKYESTIVYTYYFWEIVLHGLVSDDPLLRKISIYLAKRSIDYVSSLNTDINVKFDNITLFSWDHSQHNLYKHQWDNFFILIDSLEEKQSNIVLPSLQLFQTLTEIDDCWLNCAYNLGLRHDNGQVRLKCVEHRVKSNINSSFEAAALLTALNDISFYENTHECKSLKEKLSSLLKHESNIKYILKAIPQAHLSPVPFYHLSDIIAALDVTISSSEDFNVSQVLIDILKTSCNIKTIREAIHYNIAHFVGKTCKHLHWKAIASIYFTIQSEAWTIKRTKNAIYSLISGWELDEQNKNEFYRYITESHSNIDIGLLYLENHREDISTFAEIIEEKLRIIQNLVQRQYSDKIECFNDVLYMLKLQWKCSENLKRQILPKVHNKTMLQYTYCLLTSDITLSIDESKSIFDRIHFEQEEDLKEIAIQLYKTSVIFLQNPQTNLNKIVQSMFLVSCLSHNYDFVSTFSHEMIDLKHLLRFEASFEQKAANAQSLGRLRNIFYEIHCKVIFKYLEKEECFNTDSEHKHVKGPNHLKEAIDYIEKVVECGGYGCLEWILKIINKTFDYSHSYLNITQFLHRMWVEIEDLKSSNQYLPCIMEFVKVISQKNLIQNPEYNNLVILYCSKIIEYGHINNSPLYYLVDNDQLYCFIEKGNNEKTNDYGHLVYILSEILLFCPVPRKDQRIADNLTLDILKRFGNECDNAELRFNFTIQYKAIRILSRIDDAVILQALARFISSKIDVIFKAKLRYHGNSQVHRTFQTALQHLLYILYLKGRVDGEYCDSMCDWCIELLGRLPHQPSVRILLEWHITLNFHKKKINIDKNISRLLQSKKVPLTSQLTIIYWLLKRKLANSSPNEEFEFVMDTLLSHTMGQMFIIRLLAQFLSTKLYNDPSALNIIENNKKYDYILNVIQNTLDDNAKDKNFAKLKEDYFMNDFDIITDLTPFFIYHTLPRLCEVGNNEAIDTKLVLELMEDINRNTERSLNPAFREEWLNHRRDVDFVKLELNKRVDKKIQEDVEALVTIQKKYIPWKSMSDINVYNIEKKRESPSDLIVVASLIDKLPNLGGMARTSEVFGVKTYVIDSLRHVQDRQFQGLSVSAERWIDIEEVRPGPPLKEYLNRKKAKGYSVVAAEQTSSSSKLQTFKFPRKTLLLLGHEKDGIPCDLLPLMDHCVEIPQQGFVRSLNVHVTAAIFIWEYARQNLL